VTGPYLALDLGAESGRAVVGTLGDDGRLEVEEIHRFPNRAVAVGDHLYWDFSGLWQSCLDALGLAARRPRRPSSVGVDAWGVDFGLLGAQGALLGLPQCYRDPDGPAGLRAYDRNYSLHELYDRTGVQILPINTVFRLNAMAMRHDDCLDAARRLLFVPDLVGHLLGGRQLAERTVAVTSQLVDARSGNWALDIAERVGLDPDLLPALVEPATPVGQLSGAAVRGTGLEGAGLVAVAGHDTASAVAAVPAADSDFAYASAGTWSLIGVECARPVIDAASRQANFTNEAGLGGTVRLLRNVTGFWLLAECRRAWAASRSFSYSELEALARAATPLARLIDPDFPFDPAADMAAQIHCLLAETGQPSADTPGDLARCVLDSLALAYRRVLAALDGISPHPIRRLHIVGGGARNRLFCQLAADATGLPVLAGPVEATAIGNVLVQAMAEGAVASLPELRDIVRRSIEVQEYTPADTDAWAEAELAFERLRLGTARAAAGP
jgi:rhamnulokinase